MSSRPRSTSLILKGSWLFFALLALTLQMAPRAAHAATSNSLSITPVIIDEKVKAQDILNESVSITNTSDHKLTLYPSVNDVHPDDGQQPFQVAQNAAQASDSISNWIELSRGVIELNPGEEKTVPFVIRVPRDAVVGSYHADISFANGSTREDAVARGSLGDVTVNADLQADIVELLQLDSFSTNNLIFAGDDALFTYQVENTGNQPLDPKGEIRIYDRRGAEVASVNVNNEGKVVSPDQVSQLASAWSAASGFGRYKAVLDVDYGTNQVASVQDIAYFWVIPWKQVLAVSLIALVGLIFLALYFERWFEDRHFAKFAAQGLVKVEGFMHRASRTPLPIVPPMPPPVARPRTPADTGAQIDLSKPLSKKEPPPPDAKRPGFASADLQALMQAKLSSARMEKGKGTGGTIDLKQMMRPESGGRSGEEHVINLKG